MARAAVDRTTGVVFDTVGVRELLRALSTIDKDLQAEVRDASNQIATDLLAAAGRNATTPLQHLVMSGLKVKRDRIPIIRAGRGALPGHKAAASDLFFGAEFGGGARPTTKQFLPHRGRQGYFLYPAARANGRMFFERWGDAVDKAFESWSHRG